MQLTTETTRPATTFGLSLITAMLVAELLAVLIVGAAFAGLMQAARTSGRDLSAYFDATYLFATLVDAPIYSAIIVGLVIAAGQKPLRTIAVTTAMVLATDVVLGSGYCFHNLWLARQPGGMQQVSEVVGWMLTALDLVAAGLLLETMLCARRVASTRDGPLPSLAARIILWTAGVLKAAVAMGPSILALRVPPWPKYGVRCFLSLLYYGVLITVAWSVTKAFHAANRRAGGVAAAVAVDPGAGLRG